MSEPFELPDGWVKSTLGDVCEPSQYGYTAKAGSTGSHRFLRTTDITKEHVDWSNVPYCSMTDDEAEKYLLSDGDIVISRAGSVGFSKLITSPPKSVFASYLIRFRPLINPKYVSYYLLTPGYWGAIDDGASGIAVQNVNARMLSQIELPVAPEKEQLRIVEKLEELLSDLDDGVAELKAAQIKLMQYRQSLLKSAMEGSLTAEWRAKNKPTETGEQLLKRILTERRKRWEKQKLAEFEEKGQKPPKDWQKKYPEPVAPDISELPELPEGWVWATIDQLALNKRYGSSSKTNDDATGVPVLRMGNIQDGEIDFDNLKYLPRDHKEFPNLLLNDGDLLFNRTNSAELVGKTAVYRGVGNGCSYASYLISVTFSDGYLPEMAAFLINSVIGKEWIANVMNQTAGQANVNGTKLGELAVPLPPQAEQKAIVSEMLRLRKDIGIQLNQTAISIQQSEAQRNNILKDAFSGKLVDQDPNDEPASALLDKIKAQREPKEKPKTNKKKAPSKVKQMLNLEDILKTQTDWIEAQQLFRQCGISDSADTDQVEAVYGELRKLDQANRLDIKRKGDADFIKIKAEKV